jgi:enoyl-CoA hydratase/carnithine racemase
MVRTLLSEFQAFEQSNVDKLLLLKSHGRAFCAGGDVKCTVAV